MILNLLFYLTLFLFSFGQLGRISFLGQQVNTYLYEIPQFLIILILFYKYKFEPIKKFYEKFKIIYFFFVYLFISYLISLSLFKPLENFVGFLYFFRLILYFTYWMYLTYWVNKNNENKKILINCLLIFIFLTSFYSTIQYFFYSDLRNLIYAGWDPHLYRLFGTFFDTSVAGAIYGLIFFVLFLRGNQIIKNRFILIGLLAFFLIFILLTYSRSLYLALVISIILHAVLKRWYKGLVIFSAIFFLFLVVSPKRFGEGVNLNRMFSVQSRVEDYKNAFKIWRKNPLFGIGYNRIRYEKVKMNIIEEFNSDLTHSGASFHSSFLIILVSSGVIGLILFILILFKVALINEFSKYAVFFLSLMSLSDNILLHAFILFLLFSLIALTNFNPSRKLR